MEIIRCCNSRFTVPSHACYNITVMQNAFFAVLKGFSLLFALFVAIIPILLRIVFVVESRE